MAQLKGGVLVEERKKLAQLISQWNVDHYDLFELSQPNENLEFHGVVRFYFQGAGANVVTKCIRVSSTATTKEVIDVLVEKFRPDMRMLTQDKYALYEVHVNGEENKLRDEDHPLLVQLNWGRDVREGRFLLKRENEATAEDMEREMNFKRSESSFKRKSKREKKKEKKKEKEKKENGEQEAHGVAERLYQDLPETSFTRSISNPEAVMRRRRQQKIEKRMQQMRGQDGGPDQGGMLKIYGETVRPDVPYKTLLVHIADTAGGVVMEAMAKYGLEKEDPTTYCLVMVIVPPSGLEYHGGSLGEERILDETECPLALVMGHPKNKGHVIFQLRRRPSGEAKSRGKPMRGAQSHNDLRYAHEPPAAVPVEEQPFLQEMYTREQKMHRLPINVTEVGSERSVSTSNQYLQLQGADIMPRHCVVAHTEGIVTVTPTSRDAEVYVEHQRIYETTMLKHNMTVQFGKSKAHLYRFVDPRFENRKGMDKPDNRMQAAYAGRPQETNFDLDGHVETVTPHQRQPDREEMQRRPAGEPAKLGPGLDNKLPASLEFRDDAEQPLLNAVILNVNSRAVQFKLAPTYTLYMMVRHYVENHFHPQTPPQVRRQRLSEMLSRIARMVQDTIQSQHKDPTALAFWMANASEVLHVIKSDRDVGGVGEESQEVLAEAVQMAFHHLVMCLQNDLQRVMPAFLDPTDSPQEEDMRGDMGQNRFNPSHPSLADVLNTLSAAMTLLRRCRVNAALTIQFFSQLFHFINMWLFNIIVTEPQLQLCTRSWGIRLKRRLGQVEAWAEKQGLELAADCHLCRIIQAAHLLQAAKTGPDDITNISSTCFKLNSKQIRALLSRYINEPNEPPISPQFIERVVVIAESMADELARTDGREVRLEEDADLRLPFLLPEDGYSCDTLNGVPGGLPEFIKPFTNSGLCNFIIHSETGSWTVHMGETQAQQKLPQGDPEVMTVAFGKVKGSMGLSIVAAMGENQSERGIYIKSVVPGGAAAQDGRLQAGDQLLEVDGRNLVGLTQDKAAELMTRTGQTVTLKVAKQGAIYHGLATLLSQPSPTLPRAAQQKGLPVSNHLKPKGEEAPPPYSEGSDSPRDRYPPEPTRPTPTPRTTVPPTAQPRTSLENQFRDGPDRVRATSSGNLPNDTRGAPPPQRPLGDGYYRPNAYEQDPRSKSTSNLHVDTSFDRGRDPYNMKPAQSVSALSSAGFNSPGGRGANPNSPNYAGGLGKMNDYENQPQLNTSMQDAGKDMRGYPDINQNVPPGSKGNPNLFPGAHIQRPNDRSSVSSRTSNSSSQRETRPQSAYYDVQAREREEQAHAGMRPKSDEITPNRLKEWQDKYEDGRGKPGYEQDSNSPPYSNIPPQHLRQEPARESGRGLTAHQRLFGQRPPQQQQQQQQPQHPPQQHPPQQHPPQQQHLQPQQPQDGGPRSPYAQGNPPHAPYANGGQQRPPYGQESAPRANFPADNQQRPGYGQETPPRMNYSAEVQQRPGYGQERPPYGQENQQPGFNGQDLGRMNAQNQARQPNFYENTMPQPQEPAPQFNQIGRHPDFNKRPPTAPKPSLAPKPNQPRVQPQDMPVRQVDNRMSQPNFFENKPSPSPQMPPVGQQQQQGFRQPKGADPIGPGGPRNVYGAPPPQMSPHEGGYGYANEVPPDLPPPPEEFHEDSPPLPPPPANYLLEQQLADEQRKMMSQMGNAGGADPQRFGGNQRGFPPTSPYQPMQQVPPPPNSQQNSIPNYQNIHFGGGGYSPDAHPPPPPAEHNVYEQYDARQQDPRRSEPVRPPWQQQQQPPQQQPPPPQQQLQTPASVQQGMPLTPQSKQISPPRELLMPGGSNPTHLTVGEGEYTIAASPWEREQREKMMEKQEEELSKLRDQEIAELENRTYLNPQEQERLRKLKLEQEFQRRVREASEADYDDDSDSEATERLFTRERMIQGMKEDLEKIKIKMAEYDQRMMRNEYHMEKERAQRLERRLEMFEKDREEQHERLRKRQERKQREHQEQLQQQREMREKQRQSFEEQKRLLMMEEEKMKQRREEELQKKRQMEREQLAEMQAQREKEEAALRAEARQREEEYQRQRFQQQQQERLFQQRPIRVAEERRRLDAATVPPPPSQGPLASPGYQQYANLPPQGPPQGKENFPPPPPERTSSHDLVQQHRGREFPSALRSGMERDGAPLPAGPKKSVTFNTQLETQIHQYSVSSISDVEGTPNASVSSYRSSSQSSDQEAESPPYANQPPSNDVFSPAGPGANPDIRYHHSPGTPGVIGAQEVYRDPKLRIEAQKAQLGNPKKLNTDRMSFRDKMKFFAAEAGEDSPKYKAKASRTQRTIESQLNGK